MDDISEARAHFLTHANYIKAFAVLTRALPHRTAQAAYADCANRVVSANCLPKAQRKDIDCPQVKRSLAIAWGTEQLMRLAKTLCAEDELKRLSNTWTAVQAYYVLYHATQAVAVAKGHARPENHAATQNLFADFWASRRLLLPPWSLAVGDSGAVNTPPGVAIENLHSWTECSGDAAWSVACKALRTTWKDDVADAVGRARIDKKRRVQSAWQLQEKSRIAANKKPRKKPAFALPRLNSDEQQQVRGRVRSSTVMDYLYRLRIRTNYEDSAMFTDGPQDEEESSRVGRHLRTIAGTSLLLHELAVFRYVGRAAYLGWVGDWVKRNVPTGTASGVSERRDVIASLAC